MRFPVRWGAVASAPAWPEMTFRNCSEAGSPETMQIFTKGFPTVARSAQTKVVPSTSRGLAQAVQLWESVRTVMQIQGEEWEREIRFATAPLLVNFCTSWCRQCRILGPSVEELTAELGDEVQVAEANLDHAPRLAHQCGIFEVPTLILFLNGAPIAFLDPWMPLRQMKAQLLGLLADYAPNSDQVSAAGNTVGGAAR